MPVLQEGNTKDGGRGLAKISVCFWPSWWLLCQLHCLPLLLILYHYLGSSGSQLLPHPRCFWWHGFCSSFLHYQRAKKHPKLSGHLLRGLKFSSWNTSQIIMKGPEGSPGLKISPQEPQVKLTVDIWLICYWTQVQESILYLIQRCQFHYNRYIFGVININR